VGAASDGSGIVQIYESMVDTGHESYDPRLDYRGVIEVKMNEARKEERGYER